MKKLVRNISYIIELCLLLICLNGCEYRPQIAIKENYWRFDNKTINIEREYTLDQGHSYDIEYSEDGMDITIHFKKQKFYRENTETDSG